MWEQTLNFPSASVSTVYESVCVCNGASQPIFLFSQGTAWLVYVYVYRAVTVWYAAFCLLWILFRVMGVVQFYGRDGIGRRVWKAARLCPCLCLNRRRMRMRANSSVQPRVAEPLHHRDRPCHLSLSLSLLLSPSSSLLPPPPSGKGGC